MDELTKSIEELKVLIQANTVKKAKSSTEELLSKFFPIDPLIKINNDELILTKSDYKIKFITKQFTQEDINKSYVKLSESFVKKTTMERINNEIDIAILLLPNVLIFPTKNSHECEVIRTKSGVLVLNYVLSTFMENLPLIVNNCITISDLSYKYDSTYDVTNSVELLEKTIEDTSKSINEKVRLIKVQEELIEKDKIILTDLQKSLDIIKKNIQLDINSEAKVARLFKEFMIKHKKEPSRDELIEVCVKSISEPKITKHFVLRLGLIRARELASKLE
jgi:hypothetical protein